jgi:ubiquinone/menaquinone biosynthesis C-methylase UbiE
MKRESGIQQAYDGFAKSYDEMISGRSWWAKPGAKLVWGFPDMRYSDQVLDHIRDDFSGTLLDVPAGTGALTADKYRHLSGAALTCLDYSGKMLAIAKERFASLNVDNVTLLQGDVGALPFGDCVFDIVLTMNGLHVFPDKDAAFRELYRVLKPKGVFLGCCYISGEVRRTDWFVRHIYTPRKFFTPPYRTKSELEHMLRESFAAAEIWTVGAIAGFKCVK